MLSEDINSLSVYKYGLYISTVVGSIQGISYKNINHIYKNLPIYNSKDILINGEEIAKLLNKEPGKYLRDILNIAVIRRKIWNM